MTGLLSTISSALTIGSYGNVAKPGVDFGHLAPNVGNHIQSDAPQQIQAKAILPKAISQEIACGAIEQAEALTIQEVLAKDYVKATKLQMDKLEQMHGHAGDLQGHAMTKLQKIAGRNRDFAKAYMINGYGRQAMKAELTGVKSALEGRRGVW